MSEPSVHPLDENEQLKIDAEKDLFSLTDEEYFAFKKACNLHLTSAELRFCRPFFRLYEKRMMRDDELGLLDAIAEGNHALADRLSISTLYLNDERQKETYKDVLAKHAVLHRRAVDAPPTLGDLSGALEGILYRAGRATPPVDSLCLSDPFAVISAISRGYTGKEALLLADDLPVSRVFLRGGATLLMQDAKSVLDDALILLCNPDFTSLSVTQYTDYPFLSALERFVSSPIYHKRVHAVRTIDYRGILYALSTLSDGIYTELRALPIPSGEIPCLSHFARLSHGSLILSVEREKADEVVAAAEAAGITAIRIARAIAGGRITVRVENGAPYSCPSSLIRGLGEFSPSLTLTAPEAPMEVSVYPDLYVCTTLDAAPFVPENAPMLLSDGLGYTAFGMTSHDFLSSVRQALYAVLRSSLHGVKPTIAHVTMTYPTEVNSASVGRVFGALLGFYRAFAELAIPMQVSFVRSAFEGSTVILRGSAEGKEKASLLTVPDHPVYLLYPRVGADGFPNFADLRAMLSALRKQDSLGNIVSATAHNELPLSSAVLSMCGLCGMQYAENLPAGFLSVTPPAPYLLLESAAALPEMFLLGRVGTYIPQDEASRDALLP